MEFIDSETYENLEKALQHEALAYLTYQFYQKQLNNETRKYNDKLNEIIHNEKEHAEIWYKKLNQQLNT